MSKDIKKALEHCVEWNCDNCPNREELGSGEIVCRGRLLPEVLEYVADLEAKLAEKDKRIKKLNLEAQKYYEDAYCNDFHNQDKISFAIAELEKVKDYAQHIQGGLINYIDNQIKELGGEKNE